MSYMSFEDYANLQGMNFSCLKEGRRSAKHLKHRLDNQREDTIRLGVGRASHCFILTPELFEADFAVWRGGDRRGKDWLKFKKDHPGRTVIKADEYADCVGMRDAVMAHPVAGPLLKAAGESEKVITWVDPATEVPCKARLDRLSAEAVIDIKTTVDADPHRFGALAHRYGYNAQLAFYLRGLKAMGLNPAPKIIAVETSAPYGVAVFSLTDDDIWAGDVQIDEWLRMVAAGLFSGLWPDRHEEEVPLKLPAYAFPEVEDGLGIILNEEG